MLSQNYIFDDRDVLRLLADEPPLSPGLIDTGYLEFSIQLKFRKIHGHYPESINENLSGRAEKSGISCLRRYYCVWSSILHVL